MIAKINPNRTFAVLADYTNNKEKDARIIAHKDVCTVNNQAIADSFEAQASANKRVRNPCKHISLSFSPHDTNRMTDDFMAKIAEEKRLKEEKRKGKQRKSDENSLCSKKEA